MTIKEHALTLFDDYKELTVKELAAKTNASKQMIHHVLNELLSKRMIQKLGRTPKTSYRLVEIEDLSQDVKVPHLKEQESLLLNDLFLMVDETGNLLKGAPAFALWCAQRGLSFQKTLDEFDSTLQNYKGLYDEHGNINGTEKLLNTKGYDKIWIENAAGERVDELSGRSESYVTEYFEGSSGRIRFSSDYSVNSWGFLVTRVQVIR